MNGIKTMLLGIGVSLAGIAIATMNVIDIGAGLLGLLLLVVGYFRSDKTE